MISEYYTSDYLGTPIQDVYRHSKTLIEMLEHGNFEWDSYQTDDILILLKNAINKIDI